MLSITNCKDEYIINKSKFICYLYNVNSIDEINNYLVELKTEYKDATHHCYAYILDNMQKCSDDGEPIGTAGKVMLSILNKHNLNHTLCVVIRYFGGIKLGVGGLSRAYSTSLANCLNKTSIIELNECYIVNLKFSYEQSKIIDNLVKEYVVDKTYDDMVTYKIIIPTSKYNIIEPLDIEKEIIDKVLK